MKTELEVCQDLMEIICQCEIRIIKAKKAMSELTGIEMDDNNGLMSIDEIQRDIKKQSDALADHNLRLNALTELIHSHKNDVSAQLNAQELRLAGGWNKWAAQIDETLIALPSQTSGMTGAEGSMFNRLVNRVDELEKRFNLTPTVEHEKLNELIESQVTPEPITEEKQATPPPVEAEHGKRKCGICGVEFEPKMKTSTFCSRQCSKKNANANYKAKQEVKTEPAPTNTEPPAKTVNNDEFHAKLEKLKAEAKDSKIIHTVRPELNRSF